MRPIVYTCVSNGYDAVHAVPPSWACDFVMLHDNTVAVPEGWRGIHLEVPGLSGADLNRYAKMLPHRLFPNADHSLYMDGNIFPKQDPAPYIVRVLGEHAFAAYQHPQRDCSYHEIRENLRLGFIGPGQAWRQVRMFERIKLPRQYGLFEANILFRQHQDHDVRALNEMWWKLWQGGLQRDQPLLMAAIWNSGVAVRSLGDSQIHDDKNDWFGIVPHSRRRTRSRRIPRRLAAEMALYRLWMPG